jgi:hypothetical protein
MFTISSFSIFLEFISLKYHCTTCDYQLPVVWLTRYHLLLLQLPVTWLIMNHMLLPQFSVTIVTDCLAYQISLAITYQPSKFSISSHLDYIELIRLFELKDKLKYPTHQFYIYIYNDAKMKNIYIMMIKCCDSNGDEVRMKMEQSS